MDGHPLITCTEGLAALFFNLPSLLSIALPRYPSFPAGFLLRSRSEQGLASRRNWFYLRAAAPP